MLQQTRVGAVLEHYRRFLERFPTVQTLAAAREASVLAAWSGLGYYRRARMLHAAAKKIVKELDGVFPSTAEELRALPGVGRYTSAAIASIAFEQPVAVVDGNVERVLGRVFGRPLLGEPLWQAAESLLAAERPGDFNQAMMELGATVCVPRGPLCLSCPICTLCATRGELPRANENPPQKKVEVRYALDCRQGRIFLVKRSPSERVMPGMWELPAHSAAKGNARPHLTLKHSITVTDYTVLVMKRKARQTSAGRWIPKSRLEALPLTGLARKILRAAEIL